MHQQISDFLQSRIDAGDFPSAVYLVAEKGEIVFQDAIGHAVVEPDRIEAKLDTIYDIASLTKPLVTGLIITKLVEGGKLDPNARIGDLLNEFYTSANAEITINQLMMHTSGLPAWRPLYLLAHDRDRVADEIASTLANGDSEPVVYSDLNFITLALAAEEITGLGLAELVDVLIVRTLGLVDTHFNPAGDLRPRIAASEKGNEFEMQTCIEQGYLRGPSEASSLQAFRSGVIWGEVHDGNAWFMGGIAGHAGLFSTAEELFRIAQQFLPGQSKIFSPETCDLFRTNFTNGMNEDRSFGFQLASTEGSTAGSRMSSDSFGHNGFTGTSLWIDPGKERVFILLTNRTHDHPLPFVNINSVRRRFHDLAIELLEQNI